MGLIRKRKGLIIALLLVIIIVGITGWARRSKVPVVRVETSKVERGSVETFVSAVAIIEPFRTVEIKSNVGGQLVYLGVDEGDSVTAGQVIARIDPTDARSALDQSQADLEAARAKVSQAQQSLAQQQVQHPASLTASEQAVETAKVRLAQAREQAKLQKALTETSITKATQAIASAKARLTQAQQQAKLQPQLTTTSISEARSSLASAESDYKQLSSALVPQQLASAQSSYDQAKASYDLAEKQLARQKELFAKGFVPRSEVDVAEQSYANTKAQLANATKKLATIQEETQESLIAAKTRVDQAKASLAAAEANRTKDDVARQDVVAAEASVKQAEAELASAQANRAQDTLADADIASAEASLKQAEAELKRTSGESYQTSIKQADITSASASVRRSEASVINAQTELGYTTIVAPCNGIVITKYVDQGTVVAGARSSLGGSSGVTLLDVADTSKMFAVADVDETDIAQITVGQQVKVTLDAYADAELTGVVTKIAPGATTEQSVTTIPVTVQLDTSNINVPLRPGMNATCDFVVAASTDVLVVPTTAVKTTAGRAMVTVIQDGQLLPRRVEVGLEGEELSEITSGLNEGEQIATTYPASSNGQKSGAGGAPSGGPPPGPGGPGFGMMRP